MFCFVLFFLFFFSRAVQAIKKIMQNLLFVFFFFSPVSLPFYYDLSSIAYTSVTFESVEKAHLGKLWERHYKEIVNRLSCRAIAAGRVTSGAWRRLGLILAGRVARARQSAGIGERAPVDPSDRSRRNALPYGSSRYSI